MQPLVDPAAPNGALTYSALFGTVKGASLELNPRVYLFTYIIFSYSSFYIPTSSLYLEEMIEMTKEGKRGLRSVRLTLRDVIQCEAEYHKV